MILFRRTSTASSTDSIGISNMDQAVAILCPDEASSRPEQSPVAIPPLAAASSSVSEDPSTSHHSTPSLNLFQRTFSDSSGHSKRVSRIQRRRSSIIKKPFDDFRPTACSISHWTSYIDAERMPWLWEQKDHLPTQCAVGMLEIKAGKLIGSGDFTKTNEIKGFKFAKQRLPKNPLFGMATSGDNEEQFPKPQYALKTLNGTHVEEAKNTCEAYDAAVRRLVLETLYLAALAISDPPCPFILSFRGFWMSSPEAFQQQRMDACHLITDRLGETLEQRMKTWKLRRSRSRDHSTAQFVLESVQTDLSTPANRRMMMHKSHPPQRQSHTTGNNSKKHKPQSIRYPTDLVALQTNYILQVAHALEFLHSKGLVLRDLRPNTIGFKPYPHHHTVQLFQLASCRELPRNHTDTDGGEALLPPDPIRANIVQGGRMSFSAQCSDNGHASGDEGTDDDETTVPLRRTLSREIPKSPRAEAKHYRAPESYPMVPTTLLRFGQNTALDLVDDDLHKSHTGGTTITRTHNRITCTTTTLARNTHRPTTTNEYPYKGYNAKADVYSLMMIYYELLAESKPFGRPILTKEQHYYQVQTHGLRPSLNKLQFPRTIKAVLEGGWNPNLQRRYSSTQIRQLLTTILPMLEDKGIHTNKKSQETPSPTLPARAAALAGPTTTAAEPRNANGTWSAVWGRPRTSKRLDPQLVEDTIAVHRIGQAKQRMPKPKTNIRGFHRPKKSVQATLQSWLQPKGMIQSELNDRTVQILLGDPKKKKKKNDSQKQTPPGVPPKA